MVGKREGLQEYADGYCHDNGHHVDDARKYIGKAHRQIDDDSGQYHLQYGKPCGEVRESEPVGIGEVRPAQEDSNGIVQRESADTNERCRQHSPRDDVTIEHIEPYPGDDNQYLMDKQRGATENECAQKSLLQRLVLVVDTQENEVGELRTQHRDLPLPTRVQERQGGTEEPIGGGDKKRGQVGDVGLVENAHHHKGIDGDQNEGSHQCP